MADLATTVGAGPVVSPAPDIPPWQRGLALVAMPPREPEPPRLGEGHGQQAADDGNAHDCFPLHSLHPFRNPVTADSLHGKAPVTRSAGAARRTICGRDSPDEQ